MLDRMPYDSYIDDNNDDIQCMLATWVQASSHSKREIVRKRGCRQESILHKAAQGGKIDVLKYVENALVSEPDILNDLYVSRTQDEEGSPSNTPLHDAVEYRQSQFVCNFIKDSGINIDAPGYHGITALYLAIGHPTLLFPNVSLNSSSSSSSPPRDRFDIIQVQRYDTQSIKIVRTLLSHGARINIRLPGNGKTALHLAVSTPYPSARVVEEILQHTIYGRDVNLRDAAGETVLQNLVQQERRADGESRVACKEVALLLLRDGAVMGNMRDVEDGGNEDEGKKSPLALAKMERKIGCLAGMVEWGILKTCHRRR